MANYAASVLAKGQATVSKKFGDPEKRAKIPTVMELALKNQQISIPNANELRKSEKRTVEIYYNKNIAPGADIAKEALHTGTFGDSGMITLNYITHVEKFSLPRKLFQNNHLEYQSQFEDLYTQKWRNLRTRHDDSALAFTIANRLQLAGAVVNPQIASANPGVWDDALFALGITAGNKSRFIQKAKDFMRARNLRGRYDVIADLQLASDFEFAMQQGAGNQANTSFQFGEANIYRTSDVISADYANGAMLIMPEGMLAGMYWNDPLNREGVAAGQNEVGTFGTKADPFGSGAVADVSMYTKRADTSANATGGSTQDILDQWELTLEIAYALPPLSTVGDSVLTLMGQLT